jgi:hypothetical protein
MLVRRTARRLGLPLRRGGRGSGQARPFFSSTEEAGVGLECRPFSCDYGLLAAPRAVARAPLDPRLHLLRIRPFPREYLIPLNRGSARQTATSRCWWRVSAATLPANPCKLMAIGDLMQTMHWYNPVTKEEEDVPAPMNDEQAIGMLSGGWCSKNTTSRALERSTASPRSSGTTRARGALVRRPPGSGISMATSLGSANR